jgi:hypothetical protein
VSQDRYHLNEPQATTVLVIELCALHVTLRAGVPQTIEHQQQYNAAAYHQYYLPFINLPLKCDSYEPRDTSAASQASAIITNIVNSIATTLVGFQFENLLTRTGMKFSRPKFSRLRDDRYRR